MVRPVESLKVIGAASASCPISKNVIQRKRIPNFLFMEAPLATTGWKLKAESKRAP